MYYKDDSSSYDYTALIRLMPGAKAAEWEVQLHGIPIRDGKGKEVVVNFEMLNFDNLNTFYTDSNGLEMQ